MRYQIVQVAELYNYVTQLKNDPSSSSFKLKLKLIGCDFLHLIQEFSPWTPSGTTVDESFKLEIKIANKEIAESSLRDSPSELWILFFIFQLLQKFFQLPDISACNILFHSKLFNF